MSLQRSFQKGLPRRLPPPAGAPAVTIGRVATRVIITVRTGRFRLAPLAALAWFVFMGFMPDCRADDQPQPAQMTNAHRRPLAEDEITETINRRLRERWEELGIEPAKACSDRTFVRRVHLDLVGRIPKPEEVQSFLGDSAPGRRQSLIETLVKSKEHSFHFADLFDALLMGRADESVYDQRTRHGWRGYLEEVFARNRPWDEVAEEILLARPDSPDRAGAIWFLYERKDQHQAVAEAVAPAFFGIRIECAQCHDHMLVDEIKQEHYWGLVAFFNRSKNRKIDSDLHVEESAIGGFSEFADLTGSSSPNLLSFLDADVVAEDRPGKDEKQDDLDELYESPVDKSSPRTPRFSRRRAFVENVLRDHPLLARAMVNRLWAIVMGRGLVHPHDEIDSMHPPSHPELLDELSREFRDSGYDVRRLIRAMVNSDAYQLRSVPPDNANDPASFAWYLERPLTAEQLARSMQVALRGQSDEATPFTKQFRQQIREVLPETISADISEALYLSNSVDVDQLIRDSKVPGSLLARLEEAPDNEQATTLLFEAILQRPPLPDETSAANAFLFSRQNRRESALADLAWSLLTGAEFRFNH